jgi:hypothetical protein
MITPLSQLNLSSVEHMWVEYHVAESRYAIWTLQIASDKYVQYMTSPYWHRLNNLFTLQNSLISMDIIPIL